jgi:hypothetical protein
MNARRHVRAVFLGAVLVLALACASGPAFTTGTDAVSTCQVQPPAQWLGDAEVVSMVCGPSLHVGDHRFYIHVRTARADVLRDATSGKDLHKDRLSTAGYLRTLTPAEREDLLKQLEALGMKRPPPDAAYSMWERDIFVDPSWQSAIEVLRKGQDAWVTVEKGYPS